MTTVLKDLLPSRKSSGSFELRENSDVIEGEFRAVYDRTDKCSCGEWYPEHACWTCHDGGRVRVTEDRQDMRFGRTATCPDCVPGESREQQTVRLRIPAIFRDSDIDAWLPADGSPRLKAEEFARQLNGTLLLYGPKGTGKSHLACGILRRAAARGIGGAFWPVIDLLDRYRSASNPDSAVERPEDIDAEMRRAGVLVLDDYGVGRSSPFAEERIFKLVDERYRERKPLIVTTNADLAAVEERVRSRLLGGMVAQTSGSDRRLTA